jgi:NADH-ubiquinone oxidoreductase chain 5
MTASWSLLFDDLTVAMLLPVLVVSSCVHVYSTSYMAEDPHPQRFFAYLSMFTAFMLVLVAADSWLGMFVGWEGIGVSSFLLIGFWTSRVQAGKSALLAMTVNRVGDLVLSVGFFAIVWLCASLDYATVLATAPLLNETALTVIGLLLLGGAMAKSAQVPLHTWLPAAMEGPTPVSALIHAATLVTAGVYLLLRSSPLLEYAPTALAVIAWTGALTTFYAAATGLVQTDLKRVIAFSTCSQVGLMVMSVGLSQYAPGLYHLVLHAAVKSLLFLAAGSVIHAAADQQDLRRLGGLVSVLPFTYTALLIGSLSLMATPFLSGFYSKDAVLEAAAGAYTVSGAAAFTLGTLGATLTAFYSFRLLLLAFFTSPSASKTTYLHAHEAPLLLGAPLVLLSLLSVVGGYLGRDLFLGLGTDYLSTALFQLPAHVAMVEAEFGLPQLVKLLPALGTLAGALSAILLYQFMPSLVQHHLTASTLGRSVYTFLNAKWQWDALISGLFLQPGLTLGHMISKSVDRGVVELAGPYGLSEVLPATAYSAARLDSGAVVTSYALTMLVGLLVLVLSVFAAPLLLGSDTVGLVLVTLIGVAVYVRQHART